MTCTNHGVLGEKSKKFVRGRRKEEKLREEGKTRGVREGREGSERGEEAS